MKEPNLKQITTKISNEIHEKFTIFAIQKGISVSNAYSVLIELVNTGVIDLNSEKRAFKSDRKMKTILCKLDDVDLFKINCIKKGVPINHALEQLVEEFLDHVEQHKELHCEGI